VTTYLDGIGGWIPYTTTRISMVPLGDNRILVSDELNPVLGDVPILTRGSLIGTAPLGTHWAKGDRTLVHRIEPSGLNGPLGSVWIGSPTRAYIGIRLGDSEAPIHGWLCFARERGCANPFNWGYAREIPAPIVAGDPKTGPPLVMSMPLSRVARRAELSWRPAVAGVVVEEGILNSEVTWHALENASDPTFSLPRTSISVPSSADEGHVFRVRPAP